MDNCYIYILILTCFTELMSTESLNRTSNVINDPSQVINARVNVDVLKQRIIDQKKKQKIKRTVIFSTVCVSLGVLTLLSS